MPETIVNPVSVRDVDVCVCTFRRPSVADLLASLAKQDLPAGWRMRVIVADNDDAPSAKAIVEQAFTKLGLNGTYVHAPARNISIARNACLDAATGELLAFVDDDEIARPDWVARLIASHAETGANVVFGRVKAVYADDAPAWMRDADMHSTPPPFRWGRIEGGYTCNVLMKRDVVGAMRFNPAFGRSGGEDTVFFGDLQKAGVPMVYADDAVVEEPVLPVRYGFGWMIRRAFRAGQSLGVLERRRGVKPWQQLVVSPPKIVYCWLVALLSCWSPSRWRRAMMRAQLHIGVMATAIGKLPVELYGGAHV
ncbi:MAG: glycosyltransferase family 2 protein [Hyphomonadaceae bacterium]